MTYFSPFAPNPIVPSYYSLISIDFDTQPSPINFVFPTSFPPYVENQVAMASVVVFVNTGVGDVPAIFLPDATLGSIGCGTVFVNNTSEDVIIQNFTGTSQILTLSSQTTQVVYLKDSATQNGLWQVVPLNAAGSAPIDPSSLAGGGLVAFANQLNTVNKVISTGTLPSTLGALSANTYFNYTGSTVTWTLPNPTLTDGFSIYIKNSGLGILTLAPTAPGTINGLPDSINISPNVSTYLISKVISGATNWFTFGRNDSIPDSVKFSTQGIQVTDGSMGAPGYAFFGSLSTGLYRAGSDDLSITVEGERTAAFASGGTIPGINIETGTIYWKNVPLVYFNGMYP